MSSMQNRIASSHSLLIIESLPSSKALLVHDSQSVYLGSFLGEGNSFEGEEEAKEGFPRRHCTQIGQRKVEAIPILWVKEAKAWGGE